MNMPRVLSFSVTLLCLTLSAWLSPNISIGAAELVSSNGLPSAIADELRHFREEIEQQGQRIDRLYRVLGPHLKELEAEADRRKQQEKEDALLLMERIADISDLGLTAGGSASPAAAEFAAITRGGSIQLFDQDGNPGKKLRAPGQIVSSIAFSPKGTELLTGTEAGALLVWDLAKGTSSMASTNVGQRIGRVAWLGNDRLAWGGHVTYWDKAGKPANRDKLSGAVLARADGKVLWGFRSLILEDYFTLAGSLDGQHLAVMEIPDQPRGAFLLNGDSGALLSTFYDKQQGHTPLSVAISPNGRMLAVGYAPYDIILWDIGTGEQLKLLKGHSNWVVSLAFSADGKRLISGAGDSTARVWEVSTGKEIGRLRFEGQSTYVKSVGLSPAGDRAFALTENGQLVVAKGPPTAR
jgi:WD40 repeat protein